MSSLSMEHPEGLPHSASWPCAHWLTLWPAILREHNEECEGHHGRHVIRGSSNIPERKRGRVFTQRVEHVPWPVISPEIYICACTKASPFSSQRSPCGDNRQCVKGMWARDDSVPGTPRHESSVLFITVAVQVCHTVCR